MDHKARQEFPTTYCLSYGQCGFRDVWWCFILNEPGILTYPDNEPTCTGCGGVAERVGGDYKNLRFADGAHTFICHVGKPTRSKEYLGPEKGSH